MSRNIKLAIGSLLTVLVAALGVIAVVTALRLSQNPTQPVAPNVPQITPHAQAPATTAACTLTFTVAAPPAQAAVCDNLTLDTNSGQAPIKVHTTLTGHTTPTGTGSITGYKIDFGDGSTAYTGSTATSIEHQYSGGGTFTISGTVTDDQGHTVGGSGNCQKTVTVTPPPATYTYQTCQNNACVTQNCNPTTTPCNNLTTCTTNSDCQVTTYTHKVCLGSACTSVACSPNTTPCADTCGSNSDCGTTYTPPPPAAPQTHKACQNNACVTVSGAGSDTCTSDVSCQPKATPPPIPKSGNEALTIGGLLLGVGAIAAGLLLL